MTDAAATFPVTPIKGTVDVNYLFNTLGFMDALMNDFISAATH